MVSDITIGEFKGLNPKPPYILLVPAPGSVGREDSVAAFSLNGDRLEATRIYHLNLGHRHDPQAAYKSKSKDRKSLHHVKSY